MKESSQKPDHFRRAAVQMFRDIGFTKQKSKELYPDLERMLLEQLATGEMRIKGVITVTVVGNMEQCWNNFAGTRVDDRIVVRGACRIRPRLKKRYIEVLDELATVATQPQP